MGRSADQQSVRDGAVRTTSYRSDTGVTHLLRRRRNQANTCGKRVDGQCAGSALPQFRSIYRDRGVGAVFDCTGGVQ
jgi:hypothetical protein